MTTTTRSLISVQIDSEQSVLVAGESSGAALPLFEDHTRIGNVGVCCQTGHQGRGSVLRWTTSHHVEPGPGRLFLHELVEAVGGEDRQSRMGPNCRRHRGAAQLFVEEEQGGSCQCADGEDLVGAVKGEDAEKHQGPVDQNDRQGPLPELWFP